MSNASIIQRLHGVLDDYSSGTISHLDVEDLSEAHLQALESISLRQIHQARSLRVRLVKADFGRDEIFTPDETPSAVVQEFREFLNALPT